MDRAYTLLLVTLLVLGSAPLFATPTPSPGPAAIDDGERVSPEPEAGAQLVAAPINDAGLWLTIGGATFTAVTAGVALFYDAELDAEREFSERQELRTTGLVSAFLAIMGAATAFTERSMKFTHRAVTAAPA